MNGWQYLIATAHVWHCRPTVNADKGKTSRPALLKKNRPNKDNKDILKSPVAEEILHHWVTWYLARIRAAEMLLSICPYLGKSLYRIIQA